MDRKSGDETIVDTDNQLADSVERASSRGALEEALRETEEKYSALFAAMDQGFCICEMLLDENGRPRDYRFLEVNPMFEQHTGLVNAAGRTALELVPDLEPAWIETYGRVAISREPIRFEQRAVPMGGRWFEVYAFPFGPPEKFRFAIRFADITQRKQADERLRFLLELNGALRTLDDPLEISSLTARILRDYLRVDGSVYVRVQSDQDRVERSTSPSVAADEIRISDFGAEAHRLLLANEPFVVEDAEEDLRTAERHEVYRRNNARAAICVPLHREGRLVAAMAVYQQAPREWTNEEIDVVQLVVERSWDVIERARANVQLRESEERFRRMANAAPVLMWMTDTERRGIWFNTTWLEFVGRPIEQEVGTGWTENIHPDDLESSMKSYSAALESKRAFSMSYRLRRHDGAYRWLLENGSPRYGARGEFAGYIATCADITELHEAEERLRRANESLSLAQRAGNAGVWDWKISNETSAYVSPEYRELYGLGDEPYDFSRWLDLVHAQDRDRIEAAAHELFDGGGRDWAVEFRINHPTRGLRWLSGAGTLQRNEAGQPIRFAGINFDITERKEAEEKIARLAERLRLITDAVPALISYIDSDGRYRFVNRGYVEWFGHALEDIEGKHVSEVLGDEAFQRVRPHLESALAGRRAHFEARLPYRTGGTRYIRAEYVPDVRSDGSVAGLYAMVVDLSERKLAEEALEHSAQALREADRLKDEFLATLSHELRTPLTAILGWSQLMAEGPAEERELATALDAITRSAKAQMQLIDDVLDVSRITTGKMRLDLRSAEIQKVVEAAVETIRPSAEAKAIELSFEADAGIEPLQIDPDRIQQVAWNLLSNAIKFTPLRGRVEVAVRREGDEVVLSVEDNGPGISPEFVPHLFERFRQADSSSRRAHSGLGLGLALARDLVELHGGRIGVKTEPGRGARFTVALPLLHEDPADMSNPRRARASADPAFPGARIILVDDDSDARTVFGAMLRREGALVMEATSVDEALDVLGRFEPQLVITDIAMPERDGYDLVSEVRARGANVPVVALTAQSTEVTKAKSAAFDRLLAKPIEKMELIRNVTEVLSATGRSV